MERCEDGTPLGVSSQMMQDRCGQNHVELAVRQLDFSDVALNGRYFPSGRRPHALFGSVEHRLAQINERDIKVGDLLQQLQRVVSSPTTHVEDVPGMRR